MVSLEHIENEYKKIINNQNYNSMKKNKDLAFLMTQLEKFYDIPLLVRDTTEKHKQSKEFQLYIKISNSRT